MRNLLLIMALCVVGSAAPALAQLEQDLYDNPPAANNCNGGERWQQGSDGNLYTAGYVFNLSTLAAPTAFPLISSTFFQGTDTNFYAWCNTRITKVTMAGTSSTLYTLAPTDGETVSTLLEANDGNFYGAAQGGGVYGFGTLFQLTPAGMFTKLYDFTGGPDGKNPAALLQASDGYLYGADDSVVFRSSLAGSFTPIATGLNFATLLEGPGSLLFGSDNNGDVDTISLNGTVATVVSGYPYGTYVEACQFMDGTGNLYCPAYNGLTGQDISLPALNIVTPTGANGLTYDFPFPAGAESGQFGATYSLAGNGNFYGIYGGEGSAYGGGVVEFNYIYSLTGLAPSLFVVPMTIAFTNPATLPNQTTFLTWKALNAFSDSMARCFATTNAPASAWAGVQSASGSTTITAPATPGAYRYALTCGGVETIAAVLNDGVPTVTLTASSAIFVAGTQVTLTATVAGVGPTPTGGVRFYSGTQFIGTATVNDKGTAQLKANSTGVPSGTYSITAAYSGNSTYAAATSPALQLQVLAQKYSSATSLMASPNPVKLGQTLVLAATSVGSNQAGATVGSVTFTSGSTKLGTVEFGPNTDTATLSLPVSGIPVGTFPVTATYSGTPEYAASSSTVLVEVASVNQPKMSLVASPNPVAPPASVTLTATVNGVGGLPAPTGTVFFYSGSILLGSASLNTSGLASFSGPTSGLSAGAYTVTANYDGDTNYAHATATTKLTVQ